MRYLDARVPVDEDLLALAQPVDPMEVFRFAAPCAGDGCQHFDGQDCRLVESIVELPAVVRLAPRCAIRRDCRWWQQRGVEACRRCPMIVTSDYSEREGLRGAAQPVAPAAPLGKPA